MATLSALVAAAPLPENILVPTMWAILFNVALFLVGCLILWLIIYSAVRAALTSHRRQQAEDLAFERKLAAQRRY